LIELLIDPRRTPMKILLVWALNALALWLVTLIIPGVQIKEPMYALVAALVLALVNTLVKPVLVVLTLPITIVTLGLFLLVINALLFWAVGTWLPGFHVAGFWWAMAGALLYSVICWGFSRLLPKT
jgi:putative membrane protein